LGDVASSVELEIARNLGYGLLMVTESTELQQILIRVRAHRNADPAFDRAIAMAVEAETRWGASDPVEGRCVFDANGAPPPPLKSARKPRAP
jgi:hypothetical protein